MTGIDVHPVAVHLARAAWTLAARPAINAASAAGFDASLSIPVYLGDALQLRFRTGDMFAENQITIQTMDEENTEPVFPISLVQRAENFDALMGDISTSIERGDDPALALDDNEVNDTIERQIIGNTIAAMQRLHDRGRNHIWAYYTRNMVRPALVKPLRDGNTEIEMQYRELFESNAVRLLEASYAVFEDAARLRATTGLATPDALHAATALSAGCALFVTNDGDFRRVEGLPIVVLDDLLTGESQV